jgi:telomeric repeat-binding factor 2
MLGRELFLNKKSRVNLWLETWDSYRPRKSFYGRVTVVGMDALIVIQRQPSLFSALPLARAQPGPASSQLRRQICLQSRRLAASSESAPRPPRLPAEPRSTSTPQRGRDGCVRRTVGEGGSPALASDEAVAAADQFEAAVGNSFSQTVLKEAASCLLGMELSRHGALRTRSKLEEASSHVNSISTAEVRKVVDALQTSYADLHRSVEDPLPAAKAAANSKLVLTATYIPLLSHAYSLYCLENA